MRLGEIQYLLGQEGNDALKAPHHTRVEGDRHLAKNPKGAMPRLRLPGPLKQADS